VSDVIPLRLVMTSETREALDLVAVSHAIDVRLLRVWGFGESAANITALALARHPPSGHRTEWAASAQWEVDTQTWGLPPSDKYPHTRWRIELSGKLHRGQGVLMSESFEQSGMALMVRIQVSTDSHEDLLPTDL